MKPPSIHPTPALVKLIAEIDEFKGRWEALKTLSPDRLRSLRDLSVRILTLFKTQARLSAAQIEDLTGANRNTLKVRLRELVAAGHLQRHGKGRATWYGVA